ncbi:hypothetical protein POP12_170 [Pectobacterium phage POP12]|nr:hypothetical protein POP12_170 [Pectobacterium phage POP12]
MGTSKNIEEKIMNKKILSNLLVVLKMIKICPEDKDMGICGNLAAMWSPNKSRNWQTDYHEVNPFLKVLFADACSSVYFPVESMWRDDNKTRVDLGKEYFRQSDKWDIENNRYASYRFKLLDMLIEHTEKEILRFGDENDL